MTKEDLTPDEEVQDTTPDQESESEDALDLDDLFADDSQDDDVDGEDKVALLEKKLENIEKGVKKYFSDQGRKQKEQKEEVKDTPKKDLDDVSELFFAQVPQAELVNDDLKTIADAKYGGSILKAWRNEQWIQDKATALDNAKKTDEENLGKINKPNAGTPKSKVDIRNVKEEDVKDLSSDKKVEWLKYQAQKERESDV